jgi:hypothetical protein
MHFYIKPTVSILISVQPVKHLVFKSYLHKQEAELSDMYCAAQVEKLTAKIRP